MMLLKSVRVCPELMREMGALGFRKQSLVYAVLLEMVRTGSGSGLVEENALLALVARAAGVQKCTVQRHYLLAGDGKFWRLGKGKVGLIAPEKVTTTITEMSVSAGRADVIRTNPPGSKFIEIPLGESLERWYANVLAAWHNSRADHTTNISRFTLQRLFGVTTKTLLRWEKAAKIEADRCYITYTDDDHLPAKHAYPTIHHTSSGLQVRATARHSNIYHAPIMKENQHHKTPRRMRRAARAVLEVSSCVVDTPDRVCELYPTKWDEVGFSSTGRRNFFHSVGRNGFSSGFKKLADHLNRHGDDIEAHQVLLGYSTKRKAWLFEQSADGIQRTSANDRLSRRFEDHEFEKIGGRAVFVAAWREMVA